MARLWLLDFDGTLVDSEKAIKKCYLEVTMELLPERCNFVKNMIIGPTLDESSRMILTYENLSLLDEFKYKFKAIYDEKVILETPQYNRVDYTLNQLYKNGDHICIITNKRSRPTHKLINHYGWNNIFLWVACMDEFPKAKNKSEILTLKKIKKNIYKDIYLIGDTLSDGEAAKIQKIKFLKANYGYGRNQNWKGIPIYRSINKFEDILFL